MRALNIAATGMHAQQTNIEVTSNNIANMTTTAYKRQRAEFEDLMYEAQRRVGTNSSDTGTVVPTGIELGLGVKTGAVYRINEAGSFNTTNNSLDMAIKGRGMFSIELPSGEIAYTRAGSFQLSPEGEIVTSDGYIVQPGIVIPAEAVGITINSSGEVQVTLSGQQAPQTVGQFELTSFVNEAGLEAIGDNLLIETVASGAPIAGIPGEDGIGTLQQGMLEASNVDPVTEITNLIVAQRGYELNSKVITTADQMLQALNNTK
ncbi:MAG: flagellar basal-body rod protein FlgG [Alphaproteobacteria bacterium]|nr:flagellar basal-body rod protein FlgG [Alphaproteobacteria bacterium]